MEYVIPVLSTPSLAVAGARGRFPVHRIYCVGRNYAEHAREMGHDPDREPPFFFMKPADAIVPTGRDFAYPSRTEDVHHEIELVVALGAGGADIPAEHALEQVYGYAVGLDMTRRDLQAEAKKRGGRGTRARRSTARRPAPPIAARRRSATHEGRDLARGQRQARQTGDLAELIWKVPEMIAYLSRSSRWRRAT